jgi:hypothetical protein
MVSIQVTTTIPVADTARAAALLTLYREVEREAEQFHSRLQEIAPTVNQVVSLYIEKED